MYVKNVLKHELNTIYYLHCAYQDSIKLRVATDREKRREKNLESLIR